MMGLKYAGAERIRLQVAFVALPLAALRYLFSTRLAAMGDAIVFSRVVQTCGRGRRCP